jgi:hypothetical protein
MTVFAAAPLAAQEPGEGEARARLAALEQAGNARFVVETRVTRGAPYAAEAVSEFVQVLSDGNRIVRRTTTRLVRDSEGRTRRETIGAGGTVETVVITDPVSGNTVVLDPATRTARRGGFAMAAMAGARGRGSAGGTVTVMQGGAGTWTSATQAEVAVTELARTAASGARGRRGEAPPNSEPLGEQTIEGVKATGTRTTTVIAAGAIGNEQPITVVSEQWFSPELQMLILTKHTDPRVGETIYRVSNIVRSEPDHSLFQVPSDYTFRTPE